LFGNAYHNRRVLLTGHTGFKGSWLALWLKTLGAEVSGVALDPETAPDHWDLLKPAIAADHRQDIRDGAALAKIVKKAAPEIVFHMAAQPLVRRSYKMPVHTWATNVMGTVNLLEACRAAPGIKAIVVVTTDKCYENIEEDHAYRETDRLGGHDPYSASKAGAELAAASYRDSFFSKQGPLLATARAGNVIGGGDWSEDRLIPDLARAQAAGKPLIIRSPNATRPWQHVLEPLAGYLQLGQGLLEGKRNLADAWNFGPDENSSLSVSELLNRMKLHWPGMAWQAKETAAPVHEAAMLRLDSGKARQYLGWHPVLPLAQQLEMTAAWYGAYQKDKTVLSLSQLKTYIKAAEKTEAAWAA
jgi:CDP-glucose 4,6-dehydratase